MAASSSLYNARGRWSVYDGDFCILFKGVEGLDIVRLFGVGSGAEGDLVGDAAHIGKTGDWEYSFLTFLICKKRIRMANDAISVGDLGERGTDGYGNVTCERN